MWGKKYCDSNSHISLKEVIGNFIEFIQFHKIPANVLMREVHPLNLVSASIIMNALAYQVRTASGEVDEEGEDFPRPAALSRGQGHGQVSRSATASTSGSIPRIEVSQCAAGTQD